MDVILYDLFLVVFGIVLGVMVSDPLKKLFTGKYKEEARQRKRVKLLIYMREYVKKHTTEELAQHVFLGKIDIATVKQLLIDIEETGLIKRINSKDSDDENIQWVYTEK
ncbi:hypothetical protein JCM9140_4321 [Halalkalibacter wakoensis JCM 9140]|uniref:Uncharacterized protein n=1 Tax=Halalkalibacter wakoensis JCM 9140 TaxID=1236970 RepID=W4Q7S0_9BACI|nr:hypothetical protein [Halalkalibacter wakoensis]GAE28126.1 hypothetical protein JCM9140_4321 [Halalkalibacter wakoensis JCM 9140]